MKKKNSPKLNYNRVILISIDALSSDFSYLFEKYFTTKYINYQTTNTWTLPSHYTMLSGQYLPELFLQPNKNKFLSLKNYLLGKPTIATQFKKLGFKSRAIVGGGFLSSYFGWGYDWDEWIETPIGSKDEWIGQRIVPKDGEFLFLHSYYVHNWFDDNPYLKKIFVDNRAQLDKVFDSKGQIELSSLVKKGLDIYTKRVKKIANRLRWIQSLPNDVLVILTSDHSELFFEDTKSFHHGNFALKNRKIFDVPLLIKENRKNKIIVEDNFYDLMIVNQIFKYLGINIDTNIENNSHYLRNKINKLKKRLSLISARYNEIKNKLEDRENILKQHINDLSKIKSSNYYKLWQAYNLFLRKLGLKSLI